ncbi:MAG: hypothetical protein WC708_13470 [Lentisphaeria bacterium]
MSLMPVRMSMWTARASRHILAIQEANIQPLPVWARGTPPESFQAAILAYRRRPFPLIVNYNDPMPHCLLWGEKIGKLTPTLDRLQHRQNAFLAQYAQAFTFPSRRLAELMAAAAGLDRQRCFVVPHLTLHPAPLQAPPLSPGLWVIYAGSFYSSVFSDTVKAGLAKYAQNGGVLRFLFVLKRPPPAIRLWIENTLPGAKVLTDLPPAAVTGLKQQAVAELVVDSARHAPLLRTKVAEAVRGQTCLLVLAPAETTTAEVATAGGGMVISPATVDTVVDGLRQAEQQLADPTFATTTNRQREQVAARFSENRVVTDSAAIIDYACRRFAWQQAGSTGVEPEPPPIEAWP